MSTSLATIGQNARRKMRRAFTLTETLVVVCSIAVLIALMLPAFSRAMDSVKKGRCASNMRQIGSGIMLYAADHDGVFPLGTDPTKANQEALFGRTIWTYVGYSDESFQYPENDLQGNGGADKNIFHCPVTKYYPKARFSEICPADSYPVASRFSYGMNITPSVVFFGTTSTPIRMGLVNSPSATALVMESHFGTTTMWACHYAYGLIPHRGGCNILYFDGHVDWLVYRDIPPCKDFTDPALSTFWSGK